MSRSCDECDDYPLEGYSLCQQHLDEATARANVLPFLAEKLANITARLRARAEALACEGLDADACDPQYSERCKIIALTLSAVADEIDGWS